MHRYCVLLASLFLAILSADQAAAWYHTPLGRWVTRDPIGYWGGVMNLYEYVGGRSPIWLDPEGTQIAAPPHVGVPRGIGGDKKACCEKSEPDRGGANGKVACCDGVKYSCVYPFEVPGIPPGSPADRLIWKCIEEHEDDHHNDVDCPKDCPSGFPPFKNQNEKYKAKEECKAGKIELACLRRGMEEACGKNPACIGRMKVFYDAQEEAHKRNCKKAGLPYP